MNLCRCENGHFFDKEKYGTCPHCSNAGAMNDGRTFAFDGTENVMAGMQPQPVPQVQPATMQSAMDNLPLSGMNASDMTIPAAGLDNGWGGSFVDTPTVPLNIPEVDMNTNTNAMANDMMMDDAGDHTVGFFDMDFDFKGNQDLKTQANRTSPALKTPIASKANTPCVGWLVAIGGKHIGTDFRLKVGKNYVGRNVSNDIALTDDKSVSREKHATVVYEPKNHLYFVQPGESSSLVYKNEELVLTPMLLKAYDIITVGEVNLLFIPLCGEDFNWTALFEEMKNK